MTEHVRDLEAVLEEEIEIHRELITISCCERDAIVEGDMESLQRFTAEKTGMIAHLQELEETRSNVSGNLSRTLGFDSQTVSLSDLTRKLVPREQERLKEIHENLYLLIQQLGRINRLNARLITRSVEFIDNNIRFFVESTRGNTTYGREGDRRANRLERKLLDQKA